MTEPEIQIYEQPKQRGISFYYQSEGRPKSIPGETNSDDDDKRTYPSILIHNYHGKGRVCVTLVTKNKPYRPHPYYLVGKDCKDGYYEAEFGPECGLISFQLAVHCVMRNYVKDCIMQKMARGINPFNVPCEQLLQTEEYDLNVVRLCIQVFLPDDSGQCTRPLSPIITNPIYNSRRQLDVMMERSYRQQQDLKKQVKKLTVELKEKDQLLKKREKINQKQILTEKTLKETQQQLDLLDEVVKEKNKQLKEHNKSLTENDKQLKQKDKELRIREKKMDAVITENAQFAQQICDLKTELEKLRRTTSDQNTGCSSLPQEGQGGSKSSVPPDEKLKKTELLSVNSLSEEEEDEEDEEDEDSDEVYLRSCCEKCEHVQQSYGNERIIPEKLSRGRLQAQLEGEGVYECAFTGLIIESMEPVLVRYSILSWSKFCNFLPYPWRIAGPIFNMQTVDKDASALKSIQLPHSLCLARQENDIVFGVLHITGKHPVIERVKYSGSHLKWPVSSLSPVASIVLTTEARKPENTHGAVLVYEDLCSSDNSHMFRIYLTVNSSSHIKDVFMELRNSERRYSRVEKNPTCTLVEMKYHLMSEQRGEIEPEDLKFTMAETMLKGYFEAFYEVQPPPFRLHLKASGTEDTAWSATIRKDDLVGRTKKRLIKWNMSRKWRILSTRCSFHEPECLAGSGPSQLNMPMMMTSSQEVEKQLKSMRSEFIKRVSEPVLNRLMDNLLAENVLNDEEMTSIRAEKYREEKARHFIDMVKKKGNKGCSKMTEKLLHEDPNLYEELGLAKP